MNQRNAMILLVGSLMGLIKPALAQQAGAWQVGAGWVHVAPQDSSEPLTFTSPVVAQIPGSGGNVHSADTLGINITYFVTTHWAVDAAMGIPPKFKLTGTGSLESIGELGQARQWSPAILAKYYFNEGGDRFRPYVGFGLTYTWFTDVEVSTGLQSALALLVGRPPSTSAATAKLDSSFSPIVNLGFAYRLNERWGATFAVSYTPIKTKAYLTTVSAAGATVARAESSLKINPITPYLALAYSF
ncbi:OmpW family outer membrane protein [Variovorax ureilyticus]|uniref:OmpW family outer membrane protein n=1 Tax=Variovorax ureilyticus TaxID=1836198 RepID=A0ABU8VPD1_9BURK